MYNINVDSKLLMKGGMMVYKKSDKGPFVWMKHKLPAVWGYHLRKVSVLDLDFFKGLGFYVVKGVA